MSAATPLLKDAKAVLFDHDGTLVDSEEIHFTLWCEILKEHGVTLSRHFYSEVMAGIPLVKNAYDAVDAFSLRVDAKVLIKKKQQRLKDFLSNNAFPLMPDARMAVERCLQRGQQLAIVTGGSRIATDKTLSEYGWQRAFSVTVTVEDVKESKPAPDCYKKALSLLGVTANEAVAVEDTEHGMQSALDANLRCIVIPTALSSKQNFSKASAQYNSLATCLKNEY
ncbi:HAD family hydrolase [Alteromonas sp. ASW11-130]|uniref:HAD family hydrolase n=1 Tax=Alteromonas sp. ASW11-130 TaxID=3015775 RepID=UPI0022425864|nr:HAD family phosphatase [Alteromonas sp. ASW11-130]MCW8090542.1 HAD family phosphatase [Alteromonas sp. ASW11-130]